MLSWVNGGVMRRTLEDKGSKVRRFKDRIIHRRDAENAEKFLFTADLPASGRSAVSLKANDIFAL